MSKSYNQQYEASWTHYQEGDELYVCADIGPGRDENYLNAKYNEENDRIHVMDESTSEMWDIQIDVEEELESQGGEYNNGVLTINFDLKEQ